eukprot:Pgem_evm1s8830
MESQSRATAVLNNSSLVFADAQDYLSAPESSGTSLTPKSSISTLRSTNYEKYETDIKKNTKKIINMSESNVT